MSDNLPSAKEKSNILTQVHLYDFRNILMPRGTMQKESLSLYISEKLQSAFDSWTDPKYGDSLPKDVVLQKMYKNLLTQVIDAWDEFITKNI